MTIATIFVKTFFVKLTSEWSASKEYLNFENASAMQVDMMSQTVIWNK